MISYAWIYLLVAAGVIFILMESLKYTRMIGNIFLGLHYKYEQPLLNAPTDVEDFQLPCGESQIAVCVKQGQKAKAILIFCHESGQNRYSYQKYTGFSQHVQMHVVSFDLCDVKDGASAPQNLSQWPSQEKLKRLEYVMDWCRQRWTLPIVLMGVSNGADIALWGSFTKNDVRAIILDGVFSMRIIFEEYIRRWAPIVVKINFFGQNYPQWVVSLFANLGFMYCQKKTRSRFANVKKLLVLSRVPRLLIYGSEDHYVSPEHQKKILKISQGSPDHSALSFIVAGAGHNEAVTKDPKQYLARIEEFLKCTLA